jgi:hypothetical protein
MGYGLQGSLVGVSMVNLMARGFGKRFATAPAMSISIAIV